MKRGFKSFVFTVGSLSLLTLFLYQCKKDNSKDSSPFKTITYGSMSDQEGNMYKTVTIGTQVWMAENLRTTIYNDGTAIPNVSDDTEWTNLSTGAYCNYNNTASNVTTYGRLYNWYAVNTNKLAPSGWHVPTDAEWTTLEDYLMGNGYNYDSTTTGNKYAKALASTSGWTSWTDIGVPGNADYPAHRNETGFSALPGGYRFYDGLFYDIGDNGEWWSASDYLTFAYYRQIRYCDNFLYRDYYFKFCGGSVRCIRD